MSWAQLATLAGLCERQLRRQDGSQRDQLLTPTNPAPQVPPTTSPALPAALPDPRWAFAYPGGTQTRKKTEFPGHVPRACPVRERTERGLVGASSPTVATYSGKTVFPPANWFRHQGVYARARSASRTMETPGVRRRLAQAGRLGTNRSSARWPPAPPLTRTTTRRGAAHPLPPGIELAELSTSVLGWDGQCGGPVWRAPAGATLATRCAASSPSATSSTPPDPTESPCNGAPATSSPPRYSGVISVDAGSDRQPVRAWPARAYTKPTDGHRPEPNCPAPPTTGGRSTPTATAFPLLDHRVKFRSWDYRGQHRGGHKTQGEPGLPARHHPPGTTIACNGAAVLSWARPLRVARRRSRPLSAHPRQRGIGVSDLPTTQPTASAPTEPPSKHRVLRRLHG